SRGPHRACCARWVAIPGVFEEGATQPAGTGSSTRQPRWGPRDAPARWSLISVDGPPNHSWSTRMTRSALSITAALAVIAATAMLSGQSGLPSTKNGDWTHYTADVRGSRYSPLDQINAMNFNQLKVAWRFKPDNLR